jgi:hypothetical protein
MSLQWESGIIRNLTGGLNHHMESLNYFTLMLAASLLAISEKPWYRMSGDFRKDKSIAHNPSVVRSNAFTSHDDP